MDSVRQMGVKHEVNMIDMYINVHVCTVIQIYMILELLDYVEASPLSAAGRSLKCNLGRLLQARCLNNSVRQGVQRTFSMVVVKHDLRTTGKYINIQMYK